MNESRLAQQLAQPHDRIEIKEVEYEVGYNHYGTRGAVDLVKQFYEQAPESDDTDRYGPFLEVYELKSEAALNRATGANEIIRQFKRHRENFFKGSSYRPRGFRGITFWLVFYATESTIEHLREFADMYETVQETNHGHTPDTHISTWHEDVDFVRVTHDRVWEDAVRAEQLRDCIGIVEGCGQE